MRTQGRIKAFPFGTLVNISSNNSSKARKFFKYLHKCYFKHLTHHISSNFNNKQVFYFILSQKLLRTKCTLAYNTLCASDVSVLILSLIRSPFRERIKKFFRRTGSCFANSGFSGYQCQQIPCISLFLLPNRIKSAIQ